MCFMNEEIIDRLNNYEGVLPKYLLSYIDFTVYEEHLKEVGIYEDTYREYNRIRLERKKSDDREKYDEDEYKNWLKLNPEFEDLLG